MNRFSSISAVGVILLLSASMCAQAKDGSQEARPMKKEYSGIEASTLPPFVILPFTPGSAELEEAQRLQLEALVKNTRTNGGVVSEALIVGWPDQKPSRKQKSEAGMVDKRVEEIASTLKEDLRIPEVEKLNASRSRDGLNQMSKEIQTILEMHQNPSRVVVVLKMKSPEKPQG